MITWFKYRNELEKLQYTYGKMMKNAFELAIKDKEKSDQLHLEAGKLLSEIKKIESQTSLQK